MALLGKVPSDKFGNGSFDTCAFLTVHQGSTDIITNDVCLIDDCAMFYNHDFQNSWPNPNPKCHINHMLKDSPVKPDRRLPMRLIKRLIFHFHAIFLQYGAYHEEAIKTEWFQNSSEEYSFDSWEAFKENASRRIDREISYDDFLDIKYLEYCEDFY